MLQPAPNVDAGKPAQQLSNALGRRHADTGAFRAECDAITESEWHQLMTKFEDANIYQSWAYGSVRWGERNLSHLVLKQGGAVVGIAQLRIMRPTILSAGIAYLRWGPVCHSTQRALDVKVARAMASALRSEYVVKRKLFLQVLPNAFLGTRRWEVLRAAFGQFTCPFTLGREKYRTFLLDLAPNLEDLRKKLDRKWRNHLNAAERNPLRIVSGESSAEFPVFIKLYEQMRQKKRFETHFRVEEFGRINERIPGGRKMRIFLCIHEDQPVAGVVCSAMGNSAIYLLGASTDAARKLQASYALQWAVIQWLKQRGIRYYDLGGIDPAENAGVYAFKRGLSGEDVSHMYPVAACENFLSKIFAKSVSLASRVGQARGGQVQDSGSRTDPPPIVATLSHMEQAAPKHI